MRFLDITRFMVTNSLTSDTSTIAHMVLNDAVLSYTACLEVAPIDDAVAEHFEIIKLLEVVVKKGMLSPIPTDVALQLMLYAGSQVLTRLPCAAHVLMITQGHVGLLQNLLKRGVDPALCGSDGVQVYLIIIGMSVYSPTAGDSLCCCWWSSRGPSNALQWWYVRVLKGYSVIYKGHKGTLYLQQTGEAGRLCTMLAPRVNIPL